MRLDHAAGGLQRRGHRLVGEQPVGDQDLRRRQRRQRRGQVLARRSARHSTSPVESSTLATAAWPARTATAASRLAPRASSRPSSVRVPGVTTRTTSRRTTDLEPRFRASAGSSICSQTATLKPGADQLGEIGLGRVHRHARHGDRLAGVVAAEGQGDAERGGGLLGVLEEQLVEVAHAEEDQRVGLARLGLEELRHHRRGAGGVTVRGVGRSRGIGRGGHRREARGAGASC